MFEAQTSASDGQMHVRVLIELPTVGVERAEDTHFDTLLASPAEHSAGCTAKQVVEQQPVVVEERPQQMRYGEGDVLPVTVGLDVLLLGDPRPVTFEAAAAAGLGLAALEEEA